MRIQHLMQLLLYRLTGPLLMLLQEAVRYRLGLRFSGQLYLVLLLLLLPTHLG
jgi:hypothetical protein